MSIEYHLVDEVAAHVPTTLTLITVIGSTVNQERRLTVTRILMPTQVSAGEHFVDEGCGGGVADDNLDCLLVPLSTTCGPEHVTDANSVVHPRLPGKEYQGPVRTLLFQDNQLQAHD